MRKIAFSLIALLIISTFLAIGLRNGQLELISGYFKSMNTSGIIIPRLF